MTPLYDRDGIQVYHASYHEVFQQVDLFPTTTIITAPPHIGCVYEEDVQTGKRQWRPEDERDWYVECTRLHGGWMQLAGMLLERSSGRCWIVNGCNWIPMICRTGHLLRLPMSGLWYSMMLDQAMVLFGPGVPVAESRFIEATFHASMATHHIPLGLLGAMLDVSGDGPVLDPFCGHGSVLVAAKQRGLQAVGVDIKREKCEATIAALEAM